MTRLVRLRALPVLRLRAHLPADRDRSWVRTASRPPAAPYVELSELAAAGEPTMTDDARRPSRPGGPRHRGVRSRRHVVRRGGRRLRQDDRPRQPVCALVERGVDVRHIAAITFTEKAAAELARPGAQRALARAQHHAVGTPRWRLLGDAPISTLHSFARRLLTEHGVAVGVPPRFEVLDTVGEAIYLEERWRALASRAVRLGGPARAVVATSRRAGAEAEATSARS